MAASCAVHIRACLALALCKHLSRLFHVITKPVYVSAPCICPSSTAIIGCEMTAFLHKLHNHKRKPLSSHCRTVPRIDVSVGRDQSLHR